MKWLLVEFDRQDEGDVYTLLKAKTETEAREEAVKHMMVKHRCTLSEAKAGLEDAEFDVKPLLLSWLLTKP